MNPRKLMQGCLVLPAVIVFAVGCTNPPGALELRVAAEHETFEPDEPIRIRATFSVNAGVVCIPKPTAGSFVIELARFNRPEDLVTEPVERKVFARCGTPYLWILPFYPMLYCGCLPDVADVAGRFHVIAEGQERTYSFDLLATKDGFLALDRDDPAYEDWANGGGFAPGAYVVKVKFQPKPSSTYPPPLLWKVCEQPVEAEAEFLVLSQAL